jgi:hypothetical protein
MSVSLIIQGPEHEYLYKSILQHINNPKIDKIIVSTTYIEEKNKYSSKITKYLEKYENKLIFIELPIEINDKIWNNQNCYRQFVSSYNGFLNASEKAFKMRTSSFYLNIDSIIESILLNEEKITTTDLIFRNVECETFFASKLKSTIYHPSDHIIGGKTEILLKIFNRAINMCNTNFPFKNNLCPERIFGICSIHEYGFIPSNCPKDRFKQLQKIYHIVNTKNIGFAITHFSKLGKMNNLDYIKMHIKKNKTESIFTLDYDYNDAKHDQYYDNLYKN